MVQGTSSDAGKSALVAGLCRYYYRLGIKVAPFKPQNMALNNAVTATGGEIGRAQAVQAAASGLEPHTDMNPVLLKPNADKTAQLIIQGKLKNTLSARQYCAYKKTAMRAVLASYSRLAEQYQMVIVEGAGSPAEINLRQHDIANMGFAEAVDCPVILIADIDKGGVFAHLFGTLKLLSDSEQQRIVGFVINRFRGDSSLLQTGIDWLEHKTGKPVLAVLPYLHDFYLDAEDSVAFTPNKENKKPRFSVVIPQLPRMSNHTDFDPLLLHPDLSVQFAKDPGKCQPADLLILPGSKSVIADLCWLDKQGWVAYINRHLRYGGKVIGVCGGYQMLGKTIRDPQGLEGKPGARQGLGLLELETTLHASKKLQQVQGVWLLDDTPIAGYETHAGITTGAALDNPAMLVAGQAEGALSADNLIMGTYLHGLFDLPAASLAVLNWAGCSLSKTIDLNRERETSINLFADTLADHFKFHLLEHLYLPK